MAYLPQNNVVSTANSTTSNLAGAAVFTGTSEDVSIYSAIQVAIFSSHVSATDGLSLQQSSDGTNWDITDTYTIAATAGKTFSVQPAAKFFRLVYTNGATLTTSLRIQTVYHVIAPNPSSQRTSDGYTNETDLTQSWAFNSIWNGTTWDREIGGNGTTTTGTQRVTLSSDSTGQVKLAAGTNVIGHVIADSGSTTTVTGSVNVNLNAGSNLIGSVTLTPNLGSDIGRVGSISATGSAVPANAFYMGMTDGTNLVPLKSAQNTGDATSANLLSTSSWVYNGSAYDRPRSATAANNTTGTGLLGAGTLGFDGTNYQRTKALTDGTTNVVQSASTATATNVSGSATSVTLLSANTARKGGSIFNDSTALLYVKFGTTASTTSFKVVLAASAYYEIPAGYNGRIDGIWASATGTARIDEDT